MILDQFKEASRPLPANPFFARLEPHLPSPGRALDLGAGWGQGARWLAERGWQVEAVEIDPDQAAELSQIEGVTAHLADMADFPEAEYQLITAVFSLFFLPRPALDQTWEKVRRCLAPGGVFAGQVLGPEDDWAKAGWASSLTQEEVDALSHGFQVLEREEVNRAGKTVWGEPKHWHIHHLILQRV